MRNDRWRTDHLRTDRLRTDRLDKVMVKLQLVPSRTKAQSLITQSAVTVNGICITKPNTMVGVQDTVKIVDDPCPWVSRGGLKLDFAIRHFDIRVKNQVALDIGASTGGFSQVLLHHGVEKIYAVDVGTHQLHHTLRSDNRVVCMEQVDARSLTPALIPEVDIIVTDVSFISLTKILPVPLRMVRASGCGIFLIKPQFEVGKNHVGKGGIVTDKTAVNTAIATVKRFFVGQKWHVQGIAPCPTLGGDGNQEYILYASPIPIP